MRGRVLGYQPTTTCEYLGVCAHLRVSSTDTRARGLEQMLSVRGTCGGCEAEVASICPGAPEPSLPSVLTIPVRMGCFPGLAVRMA